MASNIDRVPDLLQNFNFLLDFLGVTFDNKFTAC